MHKWVIFKAQKNDGFHLNNLNSALYDSSARYEDLPLIKALEMLHLPQKLSHLLHPHPTIKITVKMSLPLRNFFYELLQKFHKCLKIKICSFENILGVIF